MYGDVALVDDELVDMIHSPSSALAVIFVMIAKLWPGLC